MSTPFEKNPTWFDAEYYLSGKLAQLQMNDPQSNWTREAMVKSLSEAGFSNPYDHYVAFGDGEGLSPNPLFNNAEYLASKVAQLGSSYTVEMVAKAIHDSGMTLMQHYQAYGSSEGVNPSKSFVQEKYFDAKLQQLIAAEPDKGWTLAQVKESFAKAGITPLEHYLAFAKSEGLDKYDYSEGGAPIPHPGNTKIVLTSGIDTVTPDAKDAAFKTSDRDDTISGIVTSTASKTTFNAKDVIDGGAGVDTLKLTLDSSFSNGLTDGSVKNVEIVQLDSAAGKTFSAKKFEGVQNYVVNASGTGTPTTTLKDIASTDAAFVLNQDAGSFKVIIDDKAVSGKADKVNVVLNGVGTAGDASNTPVAIEVAGSKTGTVETLNLVAQGKDSFVSLGKVHKIISIEGAGNVTIDKVATGLTQLDASTATGKITADLVASAATLKSVIGGAGDDKITVGALATGAVLNGGAGKDTLHFSATHSGNQTISGFETFETAGTNVFNMANISDLTTVKFVGASNDVTVKNAQDLSDFSLQMTNTQATQTAFKYDGTGALNASVYGEAAGGQNTVTLATLTAGSVTDLTLSNDAASGSFTVTNLQALKATSLNINTHDSNGVMLGSAGTHILTNLDTINITGNGPATIDGTAHNTKLVTVNAEGYQGELTLDLSDFSSTVEGKVGVTVTMGGGDATLTGITGRQDTFNLSSGAEQVALVAEGSVQAADIVNGFSSQDIIGAGTQLTAGSSAFVKSSAGGTLAALTANDKYAVVVKEDSTLSDLTNLTAVATAIDAATTNSGNTAQAFTFVLDNGTSLGVYEATLNTAGAASGVKLMGIIEDFDAANLAATNFAA